MSSLFETAKEASTAAVKSTRISSTSDSSTDQNPFVEVFETLVKMSGIFASSQPAAPSPLENTILQRRNAPSASTTSTITTVALGWTTTVAVSLLLLQWIGSTRSNEDEKQGPLQWLSKTIWQMLGGKPEESARSRAGAEKKKRRNTVLLHRGSCQCGSITFKLSPPRNASVLQNYAHLGKLQYPTARIPAENLQLTSGKHLWNTYHVESEEGDIWAFSFCRSCATQLLHATEADQSSLFVNVQCFHLENNSMSKRSSHPSTIHTGDENSVGTKNSVLTTVTALPGFADPRTFSQPAGRANSSIPSSDDSDSAQFRKQGSRSTGSWKPHQSDLDTYMESQSGDGDSVEQVNDYNKPPRWTHPQAEVLDYSRRVDAYAQQAARVSPNSRASQRSPGSPSFGQSASPMVEWPSVPQPHDNMLDDDNGSISSHSGVSKDYTTTAMTVSSSSAASIDYNVSANRELLLHNMRKHLRK